MIDYRYKDLYNQDSVDKQITITYDGGNITNSGIYNQQMSFEETLCSQSELRFGLCEANVFKTKIANTISDSLIDKVIEVSETLNGNTDEPFIFGKYRVLTDEPSTDKSSRDITAYDSMYDVLNTDVSQWYNNLTFPITIKAMRDSFFGIFGITQDEVALVNDNVQINKTISTNMLSGRQVINAICEINGCFGKISRKNTFKYVFLEPKPTNPITMYPIDRNGTYEDFTTSPITMVQIRETTDDLGSGNIGTEGNKYIVEDNFLMYGKTQQELVNIATNLLSVIGGISYRPCQLNVLGNPCVEVGDAITVKTTNETINTYVLRRKLSGIQMLKDVISVEGVKEYTENVNSFQKSLKQLESKTNVLTRTLEETRSEITEITTNIENNYSTTTEMNSAITQSAEKVESTVSAKYDATDNVKGNVLTIGDSADGGVINNILYGKSVQDGLPTIDSPQHIYNVADASVNLLENIATSQTVSGVTFTVNKDKSITCNGTATADIAFVVNSEMPIEPNIAYILSGGASGGSDTTYYLGVWNKVWGRIATDYYNNDVKFTATDDLLRVRISIKSGQTLSNLTFFPMIRNADVTNSDYVPYHNVNDLVIKTKGKNLFGGLEFANALYNNNSNVVINESDKTVTFPYNPNYADENIATLYSDFKENTQYTIFLNGFQKAGSSYLPNLAIEYTDGSIDNLANWVSGLNVPTNFIRVTDANKTVRRFVYTYHSSTITSTLNYDKCGIFEGVITEDDFTIYQSTQSTIPLTDSLRGIKVLDGGNYTDNDGQQWVCDTLDLKRKIYTQRIKKVVVNAVSTASSSYTNTGVQWGYTVFGSGTNPDRKTGRLNAMSNIGIVQYNQALATVNKEGVGLNDSSNYLFIHLSNERCGFTSTDTQSQRISKFNSYLANNPITVIYELKEPIETALTDEQIKALSISTYNPTTIIFTDDIGDIEVEYYRNTQNGQLMADTQTTITQTADRIDLKVDKGDISTQLSLETEKIKLKGNRLEIESDNFSIDDENNVSINGNVTTKGQLTITDTIPLPYGDVDIVTELKSEILDYYEYPTYSWDNGINSSISTALRDVPAFDILGNEALNMDRIITNSIDAQSSYIRREQADLAFIKEGFFNDVTARRILTADGRDLVESSKWTWYGDFYGTDGISIADIQDKAVEFLVLAIIGSGGTGADISLENRFINTPSMAASVRLDSYFYTSSYNGCVAHYYDYANKSINVYDGWTQLTGAGVGVSGIFSRVFYK